MPALAGREPRDEPSVGFGELRHGEVSKNVSPGTAREMRGELKREVAPVSM